MARRKSRDELLLEEQSRFSGQVESGFRFQFRQLDDPPRIMLEILGKTSNEGIVIWFEHDQFQMFALTALQTLPLVEAMEVVQQLFTAQDQIDGGLDPRNT